MKKRWTVYDFGLELVPVAGTGCDSRVAKEEESLLDTARTTINAETPDGAGFATSFVIGEEKI